MNHESLDSLPSRIAGHIDALQMLGQPGLSDEERSRRAAEALTQIVATLQELLPHRSASEQPFSNVLEPGLDPASELRRAKEFLDLIISSSVDGILAFDREFRYTVWNPGMERITGMPGSEVIGRVAFELFPFLKQTREDRAMLATLAGAWTERTDRPYRIPQTGREGYFEAHYSPLRVESGEIVGGLGIIRDITERKATEERILQAERLNAIAQMVTGMAHESRNALQRSQACLDVLSLKVQDRPEVHDLIARIQKAQDHLHHLYEEVRIYASPIKLDRQYCDLGEILEAAWQDLVSGQTRKKTVTLTSQQGGDRRCSVDPVAMRRVFFNVLENSLAVSSDPGEISVLWDRRLPTEGDSQLVIVLRDNGPGLSPEQQNKIFEPFYTTKTQGTGLGMAIARRIVEAHGGRIVARPNPPIGAEIQITLPRK